MIVYYLIFAVATSLVTLLHYFIPALRHAKNNGVVNSITEHPIVASLTYFVVTVVVAPFVFSTIIVPSHGQRFAEGLYRSLCKPDE